MYSKRSDRARGFMSHARARGSGWVTGGALLLGACAVEPEAQSHTSHDGLQDQLDALASQVEALQGELSNLAEELDALKSEEPSGLEWEVFTHTCGVDESGPVSLGRSAEGIAVTHTFLRLASEPEDSWRTASLAIDVDAGELTIYCSGAGSAENVYVFLVALGWER